MKKLLLLSFVLFSFSSLGQKIETKEVFSSGSTSIFLDNTGTYSILSQNKEYRYIRDTKFNSFGNKTELIVFLDSLDKFTDISNYLPSYEKAILSTKINGDIKKFFIMKTTSTIFNPEIERLRKEMNEIYKTLPLRKQVQYREDMMLKIQSLPTSIAGEPYLVLNMFVEGGAYVGFTNQLVKEMKLALK